MELTMSTYLGDLVTREMLKEGISNIIKYAHDKNIDSVVALELSGRPVGYFFEYAWENIHPKEKKPAIFYIAPDVFQEGELAPDYYEEYSPEKIGQIRNMFSKEVPLLYKKIIKGKPILVLDEYSVNPECSQAQLTTMAIDSLRDNGGVYSAALIAQPFALAGISFAGIQGFCEPPWYHLRGWVYRTTTKDSLLAKECSDLSKLEEEMLLKEELKEAAGELHTKAFSHAFA